MRSDYLALALLLATSACQSPEPADTEPDLASATVETTIVAEPSVVFELLSAVNTPQRIFVRTGLMPGVADSEVLSSSWGELGAQRRIIFEDETTLLEETTTSNPPTDWGYSMSEFTNMFSGLADSGTGSWVLTPVEVGTHVTCTYAFTPDDPESRAALVTFLDFEVEPYLTAALVNLRTIAER